MKNKLLAGIILISALGINQPGFTQVNENISSKNAEGLVKKVDNIEKTVLSYKLTDYKFNDLNINGEPCHSINIPGVFLPNSEGAPDIPVLTRTIAVPVGAKVSLKVVSMRVDTLKNQCIAPAPRIPTDLEKGPLQYKKDQSVYSKNAFYPKAAVSVSEIQKLRGLDMVSLYICPFQYNPVTREMLVYHDFEIEVSFIGGNGKVGDDRLRNRWWDQILYEQAINNEIIPVLNYDKKDIRNDNKDALNGTTGFEYLIITPDNPDFISWADSIKQFRNEQGISTGIVTTTEIGGNTVAAIESYVDNAYHNWTVPPSAVLLLGDYGSGATQITSPLFAHPAGYPDFPSDNQFADVDGDDLPDIVFARIAANDASQLKVMVSKFLNYERNPPTKASFYNNPITALGWQTDRWFQLCSEIVGGYLKNVQGKSPVRINAVYSGDPLTAPWSTAASTTNVLNYFGPNGLNYIPATPQEIGGFSGGTTTALINAINSGSYMLLHRDHGYYQGWGEPAFSVTNINSLKNINNELPFVFSINCQTGAFQSTSECFAEKFERYTYNGENSGALGVIAPTEVSYSFVNDVYLWGVMDNMYPDFMPGYTSKFASAFVLPAFANAAGKYYLAQSGWIGSSVKQVTYRLFHHNGDAFMTLYTQVPKLLTVNHAVTVQDIASSFNVTADQESYIALTVKGEIIGEATGTGLPISFTLPALTAGDVITVTVTKQNYVRYASKVDVVASPPSADFAASINTITEGNNVTFSTLSTGSPTTWNWSFPGGTPSTSSLQNPVITYLAQGVYDVSLTVSNSIGSNTKTTNACILVTSGQPVADFSVNKSNLIEGESTSFTDQSANNPTQWSWSFPGGSPSASTIQNPVVSYLIVGSYNVSLTVTNTYGNTTKTITAQITVGPGIPVANFSIVKSDIKAGDQAYFTDLSTNNPTTWNWSFPGGTPSTSSSPNPVVVYTTAGIYDVTLTAANSSGSNTKIFSRMVSVSLAVPVADFTVDKTSVLTGETVSFSDLSTNNPVSWSWSFPGGNPATSTVKNPTVSYAAPGSYSVTLSVSNSLEGTTTTKVNLIKVAIPLPVVDFDASKTYVTTGESVNFIDLTTNTPTSWVWQFVGGTPSTSTLQYPSVTYPTAGKYDVTLTATNSSGTITKTKTAFIEVYSPTALYCVSSSQSNSLEWISEVSIGIFTNTSVASLYSDFTDKLISLKPKSINKVTITPNFTNTAQKEYYRIWIDFNGDKDFSDAGELVFSVDKNSKSIVSGNISIPKTASGQTRMRIAMKNGSAPTACETFMNGEVEDYNISFSADMIAMSPSIDSEELLRIYPNPSTGLVHFETPVEDSKVFIISPKGQIIRNLPSVSNETIDLSALPKGMYFIKILTQNESKTQKLILQ